MKYFFTLTFFASMFTLAQAQVPESSCVGTTQNGSLENGWQLPSEGKNFDVYSSLGAFLGRNYVHDKVYKVVVRAYQLLETTAPSKTFVYGETGLKNGGKFSPHKTHRNGLSVDFFVPVVDGNGVTSKLPISALNKFGYEIEFDARAKHEGLTIDFEAMAIHLAALKAAAIEQGIDIEVVIFDNQFQKMLFASPSGKALPKMMRFSVQKPWVRHDEHYHVDFRVQCK
jgi:penicillin-insensitive murein DD-endopeptidase